ncbi:MAG TPA: delta-60 repeat domain-containing protein [Tepidisphaeraceae bacterium]|jgi:hypothetical protein|nr:delta-60 repeat domain-containing protein [Tepidisphaeraceae bacterium]
MRGHNWWVEKLEARWLLSAVMFDSQFAGGYTPVTSDPSRVADVAIEQSDSKIIVAGHTHSDPDNIALSVSRYDTNGSIDSTFNHGQPDIFQLKPKPCKLRNRRMGRFSSLL